MWYVLGLLLLLALAQAFFYSVQSGENLSYSEFRKAVRDGQVTELILGDDRIRGSLKPASDGKARQFTTVRVEDPKLVEDLEASGVKYTGEVDQPVDRRDPRLGHSAHFPGRPVELLLPPDGRG